MAITDSNNLGDKSDSFGVSRSRSGFAEPDGQKESGQALRWSEQKYRALFEQSQDAIFIREKKGHFVEVNHACLDLFGYTRDELLSLDIYDLCFDADENQKFLALEQKLGESGAFQNAEVRLKRKDGTELDCLLSSTLQLDSAGLVIGCQGIIHDVTERKSLQAQLFQAQKMEALGRLSGGIAHDFNNLLSAILGYASLLTNKLEPGTDIYGFAEAIESTAKRAANVTQQLLTTARKTPSLMISLDVNGVVREVGLMLSPRVPDEVLLETHLQSDLPLIQGDQNQIYQLLMNLYINAFDAMPDGGTLAVSSKEVFLDEDFCRQRLLDQSGAYVELSVGDTGSGIDEKHKTEIFEPFFTTKGPGKGTGLGLAIIYAIVKNHRGMIEVNSVLGKGSAFKVYLPVGNQTVQ